MDLRFGGFKNFKKINTIYVGFNEILIYGQHIIEQRVFSIRKFEPFYLN